MKRTLLALVALILALGLIATGCGGSDDDGDGGAAPAAETEAADAGDDGEADAGSAEDDAAAVDRVVREFLVAAGRGDGDTACALFTDEGLERLEASIADPSQQEEPPTCEEIFELVAQFNDDDTVEVAGESVPIDEIDSVTLHIEVADDGSSATVTAEDDPDTVELEKVDGQWLISDFTETAG